jgi:hypothetical protein
MDPWPCESVCCSVDEQNFPSYGIEGSFFVLTTARIWPQSRQLNPVHSGRPRISKIYFNIVTHILIARQRLGKHILDDSRRCLPWGPCRGVIIRGHSQENCEGVQRSISVGGGGVVWSEAESVQSKMICEMLCQVV